MVNRLMRNGDTPVLSLRDAMDRLLEQSFTPFSRSVVGELSQTVPTNLWEDANSYHLHLLAPALDIESVEITAIGGVITISGQMKSATPEAAKNIWNEWNPTAFRRQVQLPRGFDAERCQATYKDGVLTVTLPKAAEANSGLSARGRKRVGTRSGTCPD